jgi:DNA-binding CsgD family transcriptional regulator
VPPTRDHVGVEGLEEIVGRRDELARIERMFDAIASAPRALVLEGDPGIGKTTVWAASLAGVRERFYWLLHSRAVEAELKLPFTVVGDLLEPVADETLPQLAEPQRRALEAALLRRDASRPTDARSVGVAFLNVIRSLAAVAPVVVAIDDLQWVDAASARVLNFALRRVGPEPVGVLATLRDVSSQALRLTEIGPIVERVELGPLDVDDLALVLEQTLGSEVPRPAVKRIHRASGGNPFYAVELVHALDGFDWMPGESLRVPPTLRGLLQKRLAKLPEETIRLLLAVACASKLRADAIAGAMNAAEKVFMPAIEAGVISLDDGHARFTQPLLASVLQETCSLDERRGTHRALAEVSEDEDERVRHLALSLDGPDRAIASALTEAATRTRGRGAPDEAAELYALSRRLTPPELDEDVRRRTLEEARSTFDSGDSRRARRLLEEVIATSGPGDFRAEAVRELGRLHYYHDDHQEAVRCLQQARADVGDDLRLAATIERDLTYALGGAGEFARVASTARRARTLAVEAGDDALVAEAEGLVATIVAFNGRKPNLAALKSAAELDLEGGLRPVRPVETSPSLAYAVVLNVYDRFDEARGVLLRIRDRALERGDERSLAWILFQLAETEASAGKPAAALEYADAAVRVARQAELRASLAPALYARTLALVLLGRIAEARASGSDAIVAAEQSGWAMGVPRTRCALGLLELSLGNAEAALRELAVVLDPESHVFTFLRARRLGDAIEALIAIGEVRAAETSIVALEGIAARSRQPGPNAAATRCRALLALAGGDAASASDRAAASVLGFERIGSPIELGRSLIVQGAAERRAKRRAAARRTLERAIDILDAAGATLFAARGRAELKRVGGRRAADGLTHAEASVVALAAKGRRNREIAEELFVTEKTVEAALSRAYRKLGVRSRSELNTALARGATIKL